ncbi:MAG: methyltransferase [Bacilli bacterium]|nr:methyltransferase [Bacilli bacterium]
MQIVLNDLFDYTNLKIYQYVEGFKFSLDSILLAEFVKVTSKTKSILDLCSGNAAVPMILSTKTKAQIDAFELQESIFNLAKKSIDYNKLDKQITLYNSDIKEIDNYKKGKKYDIITCNPPYFKVEDNEHINDTEVLAIARHELKINLEDIFMIASNHLDDKGEFYLVHRVSRLDEIIILGNKYNLNVKNVELIKTKDNGKPYIVLVRCIKNSKLGIKVNSEKNIGNLKTYQNMFKEEL